MALYHAQAVGVRYLCGAVEVTPQHRSTLALREDGYHVEVVEQIKRIPGRTWRVDLWGFADLLAIRRGEVLAVQVTSSSNISARVRKIEDSETLPRVREAGIRVLVHGWRKSRTGGWVCKTVDLS